MGRALALLAVTALALATAACTASSPPRAAGASHPASRSAGGAAGPRASALARAGLLVPATYEQACSNGASQCLTVPAGPIPAALNRPLHFPVLRPGQRCPASPGKTVNTADFGGVALGNGPVRVLIAATGGVRHGVAGLINPTNSPPWLALKTLWFAVPAYQGPFVIRARRLGRPGPAALGAGTGDTAIARPTVAPLVVPPGPTLNGTGGWREAPGGLWVRAPGCYAWQVDGLTFSEIIVVQAVLRQPAAS